MRRASGTDDPPHRPLWKRLGWLVLIWAASVAVLAGVALVVRWLMLAVGLTAS